jgi:hypothetical protein
LRGIEREHSKKSYNLKIHSNKVLNPPKIGHAHH